jgi:hypothetical protein
MHDELDISIIGSNGETKDSKIIKLIRDDSQNIMMTCCRYLANVCAGLEEDEMMVIRKNI